MGRYVARTHGLVVEELDGGVVLYDPALNQAHWLDADAAAVWKACVRERSEETIAEATGVSRVALDATLERLVANGLVEVGYEQNGVSRRTVFRQAAKIGAVGAVAAPIVSAVIPVAVAHASTSGGTGPGGGTGGACATESGGIFFLAGGTTVTFSNEVVNGLDDNTLGYALDNGATYTALLENGSGPASSAGGQTYTAPVGGGQFQIELHTVTSCNTACYGSTYVYLSSNPNHTVVVANSSSSWTVYMTDDGCTCCGPTCQRTPDPNTGFYNAAVTITASC